MLPEKMGSQHRLAGPGNRIYLSKVCFQNKRGDEKCEKQEWKEIKMTG